MTSNKRIHELLEGIKALRENHPNAALMISKGPGLDALWFGGLEILQHLLEENIRIRKTEETWTNMMSSPPIDVGQNTKEHQAYINDMWKKQNEILQELKSQEEGSYDEDG